MLGCYYFAIEIQKCISKRQITSSKTVNRYAHSDVLTHARFKGVIYMNSREKGENGLFACPCCGYATLDEVAGYDICHICFWEDDGQDDPTENVYRGGPNRVSFAEGRKNFLTFGSAEAKDNEHVRKPNEKDINIRQYKLINGNIVSEKNT